MGTAPGATRVNAGLDLLGPIEQWAGDGPAARSRVRPARLARGSRAIGLDGWLRRGASRTGTDLPRWPLTQAAGLARAATQPWVFGLLGLIAPAQIAGREIFEDFSPPALLVANHTSHLDSPVVLKALPGGWRRRVAVAAAADYFFSRAWLGAAVALALDGVPLVRGAARSSLAHCAWFLDRGWSILLYPEGTRSTTGEVAPFRAGVGLLAAELSVPVVPIGLAGLFQILPKGRRLPRPGRVQVRFGQPLHFARATPPSLAGSAIEQAGRSRVTVGCQ